ncbi:MAG: NAD(P)/FAD-dependent oxidoreductase [Rhodospirillaceae bacterium]|nr:NAD(P)/FAD-dependent oxidoreductase [Rhodospirillaceae bacterium]
MTYVVVGAGPAGVVAAETLRKADPNTDVVLIGGEAEPPYSRMAIPYYLTGKVEEAGTYLRKTDGHYDTLGIQYRQGRVKSIDADAGKLNLEGGDTQDYDQLLIATGASPIKPPVEGLDLPGVHHCWTLEDARKIIELAHEGADVVLIGAGFIACIILESLVERGVNLTVVEMEDRMLPRMMDETGGDMIKRWCEKKGVNVRTGARVTKLEPRSSDGEDTLTVDIDNGDQLPAHLVVVAAGVKSNTGFLDSSAVEVKTGIVVDNHLRSSVSNIYAAGDCAEGPDFSTGGWMVHAIQPTATEHGRIAAMNMAGKPIEYQGSLIMNVLDTMGLVSVSYGAWQGVEGGDRAEVADEHGFRYLRLEFDGDVLVGCLSLGRTDHVGVLRGLIQSRRHLGEWKDHLMVDPHRFMEAYVDGSQ